MQAKTVICEVGKGSSKNLNYGNRIKALAFADPQTNFCLNDVEPIPIKTIGAAKL
jgi:hypothetical protein